MAAGIPVASGATTVNKVCGSGMKAVMLAHDMLKLGNSDVVVAGGMESMSNAPYLLPKARGGMRMGHGQVLDHMFLDGLQSPFDNQMMGVFGEMCADKHQFSREAQDAFTITTVERAQQAVASGKFADEIAAITVKTRKGEVMVEQDEEPARCDISKIPTLRPAFKSDGTITAASSSSISDGAAALVMTTRTQAEKFGSKILARVVAHATFAQEPEWSTTAPPKAIAKLLKKAGWEVADVDAFEINEAFAAVTMGAINELGLDHAKVNINGGSCALGHPIGASGARLIVTLIHTLRQTGGKRGVASLCLGGGESVAVAIELP
jgi:acetyl-CoA C-acetyltransferase